MERNETKKRHIHLVFYGVGEEIQIVGRGREAYVPGDGVDGSGGCHIGS